MRWRGGGHKRLYRIIDFKRSVLDEPGIVERFEYDPNRTAHIALIRYPHLPEPDNLRYIIAPRDLEVGASIVASRTDPVPISPGNAMPLRFMPLGTLVNNIEMLPGKGSQLVRSAGTYAEIKSRQTSGNYTLLKLSSGEERLVLDDCIATIGILSNPYNRLRKLGKAGRKRWLGRRPRVRGMAMNPCDHPMGGGEARSKGGRPSCSKWGWTCKGRRTRNKRKRDFRIVTRRYNSKGWKEDDAESHRNDGRETPQKAKRKAIAKMKALELKAKMKAAAKAQAAAAYTSR